MLCTLEHDLSLRNDFPFAYNYGIELAQGTFMTHLEFINFKQLDPATQVVIRVHSDVNDFQKMKIIESQYTIDEFLLFYQYHQDDIIPRLELNGNYWFYIFVHLPTKPNLDLQIKYQVENVSKSPNCGGSDFYGNWELKLYATTFENDYILHDKHYNSVIFQKKLFDTSDFSPPQLTSRDYTLITRQDNEQLIEFIKNTVENHNMQRLRE